MIDELKPCPFCGDDAEHIHVCAYEEIVRCTNECCFVRPSVTCELPEECVELWNTRAAGASEGQAEPVAWRWRLTAEINGKQWGPGPWEYTTHPEKFDNRTLYEVEPLYLHPSAEIAALRERIAGMEKDAEIGHALIANGLYDRMNDMVDEDGPAKLIEELIAVVDPILDAKFKLKFAAMKEPKQ